MNVVEIVDRLAAVCIDSEKRYRHAANDVSRDDLEIFSIVRPNSAGMPPASCKRRARAMAPPRKNQAPLPACWIGSKWISVW